MACVDTINSWYQFIIGTATGFLVANVLLSMLLLSIISFRWIRKAFGSKPLTTSDHHHPPIDTFIESIERYPPSSSSSSSKLKPSKSEQKNSPRYDLDSWAKEMMQKQAENGHNEISSEIDDNGPGETSLFAEDYITESEHNRALASLDNQIGGLIKQISKRDQLLQKSRAETIHAEILIDELQEEVKSVKADQAKNKIIMKDLQHSIDEKEKLILELREHVSRKLTDRVPKEEEEVDSSLHSIDQEKPSLIEQQERTQSEGKPKAKDVMTYIPPNRRPLSQA